MAITHRLQLLTMFAGPVERDAAPHFGYADDYLGAFGLAVSPWPYRQRPANTSYQALLKAKSVIDHHDEQGAVMTIAKWARHCYRDRLASDVVVVVCRLMRDVGGATFSKGKLGLDFSLVLFDPVRAEAYKPTLAHELGHAAGLADNTVDPTNLMYGSNSATGAGLRVAEADRIRMAYFARAA
jgi:hypothetical protein